MLAPTITVDGFKIKYDQTIVESDEQILHHFQIKNQQDKSLQIEYQIPLLDLQYMWHPLADGHVALRNEWDSPLHIRLNQSLPVVSLFNQRNLNCYSLALSELVGEVKLMIGVKEENATLKLVIETLISDNEYELSISHVTQSLFWAKAVQAQVAWLYKIKQIIPKSVPAVAFKPVLSTWYSFHQQVDQQAIFDEAIAYKKSGAEMLILDDGWQTDDDSRRYAYAGDWHVSPTKFPDFKQHIQAVQALDMKYLIWLSLPYLGIKTQKWAEYEDSMLYLDEFQKAGILDIRKQRVREYLLSTVRNLLDKYPLDGLKLDFFETFTLDEQSNRSIAEGLLLFLSEMKLIYGANSDFLIEYRQDYINPLLMQYANIVRVKDCPNNYYLNRIRAVDLRLSCPYTAIHSDMIMWNQTETAENAALQLINVLFAVPQISVRTEMLTDEQRETLSFWLGFSKKYQAVLQQADFLPLHPQEGYSQIQLVSQELMIMLNFSDNRVIECGNQKTTLIINGSQREEVYLKLAPGTYALDILNCRGHKERQEALKVTEQQIYEMLVPRSGLISIVME